MVLSRHLTEEEFQVVFRLAARRRIGQSIDYLLGAGIFCIGGSLFSVLSNRADAYTVGAFLVGVLALVAWLSLRVGARDAWRDTPSLRRQYHGRVTDDALEAPLPGGEKRIPWTDFLGYQERDGVIVLTADDQLFIPLARSFFDTDEQWNQVKRIVDTSVTGRPAKAAWERLPDVVMWILIAFLLFMFWFVNRVIDWSPPH